MVDRPKCRDCAHHKLIENRARAGSPNAGALIATHDFCRLLKGYCGPQRAGSALLIWRGRASFPCGREGIKFRPR